MAYLKMALNWLNHFVWGAPALLMILAVGLYLSFSTGFVQLSLFPIALRNFFKKLKGNSSEKGVSSYQSLCTALSATVGTGNIAGVAGAIAIGGPGAVFWMWLCGLLGMVVKLAEATLAVHFQNRAESDAPCGGPMYMIERGMGAKYRWLACLYAFFGVTAAFGVGNATQVNAVLDGLKCVCLTAGCEKNIWTDLIVAFLLAALTAVCLLGGAKRIGKVAQNVIPFAAGGYILLGIMVLLLCRERIPRAIEQIFVGAISPKAITGGAIGSAFIALRTGISRGVFTNEAGMGTAAIAYASAEVAHPVEQGLMGIMEVFIDTLVICSITALVILCSDCGIVFGVDEGAALTMRAFSEVLGEWVSFPLAAFMALFAFATMLGWGLYGARCVQYLLGNRALGCFAILQAAVVIISAFLKTETVWLLAEIMNGLMALPNLIALLALSPVLFHLINDYKYKGALCAPGGTYESFHQCKSLRTFSYEKIPSLSGCSRKAREEDLSFKHRPAGY